jgi:hypothetical protein
LRVNRICKVAPIIAIFMLAFFSSYVVVSLKAADYTRIGVKAGDVVDYTVEHSGEPDWRRIQITEVTGAFVNLTVIDYSVSTQMTYVYSQRGNVSKGDLFYALVCAGLQAGDPLYAGAPEHFNNTLDMEIAGVTRTVNEISTSSDEHIYYDQQTGIFVKSVHLGGTNYTVVSATMWAPADQTVFILTVEAVTAAVAVLVVVLLVRRSRRQRQ